MGELGKQARASQKTGQRGAVLECLATGFHQWLLAFQIQ
jgi:hypothetical protein